MRFFKLCLALGWLVLWPGRSYAGDPQWVEVRSPNFSVITDAGDKRGRDVALHFEQMRSVFGGLMAKAHVNLSVPLQIVAFRNTKEVRQLAPVFNGKPVEVAGLFQSGEDRSFIMLDMSVDNPWVVVFHEYAHQLMNSNLSGSTDPWFEEGFAEFFSSIEVDNKEAHVGKIPRDTYLILQQGGMMRVADLFRVQHNSKTYNESGDHRNTFYAESSLVVHYLFDTQQISKLDAYFSAFIDQKKPVEQAIQEAFGMTPEQFDKALRNYLSSGRYKYYSIPTPPSIVAAQFAETPVSVADARAVLADIDAHSPSHQERALGEFQEVLKMDPNNASALRGAGYAFLQRQDFEHAREYFRQAAERDSKDPRVHYYNALLMNRAGGLNAAKSEEMKKELETAIALDPKLADAYSLLAYAQAFSGEPEKGLATMKRAVELSPRNETYQINLANIYMANRKVDEAIALFRSLAGSANPEVASHASTALAQAENFKEQSKSFRPQIERRTSENVEAARDATGIPEGRIEAKIPVAPPSSTPVRFIKGKLAAVDCSAAPQALLSVVSGGRSLKMHIGDSKHVILIGADEFSCDWKNKSVSLNYRERQDGDGDVVSLEMQ
ncbi:MAG: tetratricopeptide repeat protein [Terriglobales bacterium]|jgi:tetratricopeptide (TPR) repeat protein